MTSTQDSLQRHATLLKASARAAKAITTILDPYELFQRTVALLDRETDNGGDSHGELGPLFDNPVTME